MVHDLDTLQPLRIEVVITKATDIKMEEDFENLDILRDWAKDKIQKVLSRHWPGTRSRKKKKLLL